MGNQLHKTIPLTKGHQLSAPEVCVSASNTEYRSIFEKNRWLRWLAISVLVVLYSVPIFKVYMRKTSPEMTPRSPLMIIMYLSFLMLDSIFNTYLFSIE